MSPRVRRSFSPLQFMCATIDALNSAGEVGDKFI